MKKTVRTKKLLLTPEMVRNLSNHSLTGVAGGIPQTNDECVSQGVSQTFTRSK